MKSTRKGSEAAAMVAVVTSGSAEASNKSAVQAISTVLARRRAAEAQAGQRGLAGSPSRGAESWLVVRIGCV